MRRGIALAVLLGIGGLSLGVTAAQQPPANGPKVVEVEKLKDNLFVLRGAGAGGNTAVFVTATGVVVVDTKVPGWGQPLIAKIKELTDKPITTVINIGVRKRGSAQTTFTPSRICPLSRFTGVFGTNSDLRIKRSAIEIPRKLTPFTKNGTASPKAAIRTPATAGPKMRAMLFAVLPIPTAPVMSSGPTSS